MWVLSCSEELPNVPRRTLIFSSILRRSDVFQFVFIGSEAF